MPFVFHHTQVKLYHELKTHHLILFNANEEIINIE